MTQTFYKYDKIFPPSGFIICLLAVIVSSQTTTKAQSLIAGIPNADIAQAGKIELTHESQFNLWDKPASWNSFNFACYRLNNKTELTVNLLNLNRETGFNDITLAAGAKRVVPLFQKDSNPRQWKIIYGANLLYAPTFTSITKWGGWAYGALSARMPISRTRITMGASYGTAHLFGFKEVSPKTTRGAAEMVPLNPVSLMLGVEQPLGSKYRLIADWFSGDHDLAVLIVGMQRRFGGGMFMLAYKHPNDPSHHLNAVIAEIMIPVNVGHQKDIPNRG